MRTELPTIAVPSWLTELTPAAMTDGSFPLRRLLRDSLYYPYSAFDGDPVKHLAGNILSFIFVDRDRSRDELCAELNNRGFKAYDLLMIRSVTERDLVPRWWHPSPYRHLIEEPFCIWAVLQRKACLAADYGPHRFSLLYLCADGVAVFQTLYITNSVAPRAVAVIQPGDSKFKDPDGTFAQNVLRDNPGGPPQILLYGGYNDCESYPSPCWPAYPTNVCFYRRGPCRRECFGRCRPSAAACLLLCRLNGNNETG